MLIFIFRLAKAAPGKQSQGAPETGRERNTQREKRGYTLLDFSTADYLPRRVTVSIRFRWNPVSWIPALSRRSRGEAVQATDRQEPLVTTGLNTVPSCCLLRCRLLSCTATAVFAHAWIWNCSKYDVMCGTECRLAGNGDACLFYFSKVIRMCVCVFV